MRYLSSKKRKFTAEKQLKEHKLEQGVSHLGCETMVQEVEIGKGRSGWTLVAGHGVGGG